MAMHVTLPDPDQTRGMRDHRELTDDQPRTEIERGRARLIRRERTETNHPTVTPQTRRRSRVVEHMLNERHTRHRFCIADLANTVQRVAGDRVRTISLPGSAGRTTTLQDRDERKRCAHKWQRA